MKGSEVEVFLLISISFQIMNFTHIVSHYIQLCNYLNQTLQKVNILKNLILYKKKRLRIFSRIFLQLSISSFILIIIFQFNGLDWSLLVKHLDYEDIHNSWLYCFTNPLEIGTPVSLSHHQPHVWIWEKKVHRGKQ